MYHKTNFLANDLDTKMFLRNTQPDKHTTIGNLIENTQNKGHFPILVVRHINTIESQQMGVQYTQYLSDACCRYISQIFLLSSAFLCTQLILVLFIFCKQIQQIPPLRSRVIHLDLFSSFFPSTLYCSRPKSSLAVVNASVECNTHLKKFTNML